MTSPGEAQYGSIRDPLVGATVDERYLILGAIGQGATSSVYKALDQHDNKSVALKVLHTHLAQSSSFVERFQREARTGGILTHPNIVCVGSFAISQSGSPYIIEEFVEGLSLQQLLATEKWLPLQTAIPIFAQVCAALIAAHQRDVIHRDLKPGNIMLLPQSDDKYLVKILDFGCAQILPELGETVMKVTQTGEMLGSLLYMSPEQCLDQNVDARSDCYSLGCVMYETLTGRPPLAARTAFETMNKHMSIMPDKLTHARPDLQFPSGVEKILFKAMAKAPAKRYQRINDLLDDLLKLNIAGEKEMSASAKLTGPVPPPAAAKKSAIRAVNKSNVKNASSKKSQPFMDREIHATVKSVFIKPKTEIVMTMILWTFISLPGAHSPLLFAAGVFIGILLWVLIEWEIKSRTIKFSRDLQAIKDVSDKQYVSYMDKSSESDPEVMAVNFLNIASKPAERHEILIYGAQKGAGNNICLEISTAGDSTPDSRINIVPINPTNAYWHAFCDRLPYGHPGSKYPILALMIKHEVDSPAMIIVESHLTVVLAI